MKKRIYTLFAMALIAVAFTACIYDFRPEELEIGQENIDCVVIDGDIIPGDYTYVKVYNSVPLDYDGGLNYITNAKVWVENDTGQKWNGALDFKEQDDLSGSKKEVSYVINTTSLSLTGKYKMCVQIPGRGEYESALMPVQISPEIDSLTFSVNADSTELYVEVTTHNNAAEPLYCRWTYVADWEFMANYTPDIDYSRQTGNMVELSQEEKQARKYCWGHEVSSDVYIGSTAELTENLLYKQRLDIIHYQSRKINQLYSTLVTQTVLGKEAYEYWNNVKKSSSDMGGLFAPQPTQIKGNIVCKTDPAEDVIGYVNVSTASTKRLYITRQEARIHDPNPNGDCNLVSYEKVYWPDLGYGSGLRPTRYGRTPSGGIDYFLAFWTKAYCTDCRLVGSKVKPSYWPNDHQ